MLVCTAFPSWTGGWDSGEWAGSAAGSVTYLASRVAFGNFRTFICRKRVVVAHLKLSSQLWVSLGTLCRLLLTAPCRGEALTLHIRLSRQQPR